MLLPFATLFHLSIFVFPSPVFPGMSPLKSQHFLGNYCLYKQAQHLSSPTEDSGYLVLRRFPDTALVMLK